jgi:hypothetical protein
VTTQASFANAPDFFNSLLEGLTSLAPPWAFAPR